MSSQWDILLRAIIKATTKILIATLLVLGSIFLLLFFSFGRFFYDITGSFRRSCKNLTGQVLTLQTIKSIEGIAYGYQLGIETDKLSKQDLDGYFDYLQRSKDCKESNSYSEECNRLSFYNYNKNKIWIHKGNLKDHWTCSIAVDAATHIMTTESFYVGSGLFD